MRTTVRLDDDVAAVVEQKRREEGLGVSEAVNRLIRAGLTASPRRAAYRVKPAPIGFKVDVSNIGEVLDLLDNA